MISPVSSSGDATGDTLGIGSLGRPPALSRRTGGRLALGATGPGALMVFASGASYLGRRWRRSAGDLKSVADADDPIGHRTPQRAPAGLHLGVVLFAHPGAGAVTLALLFGLFNLIYGGWALAQGIELRHTQHTVQSAVREPHPA